MSSLWDARPCWCASQHLVPHHMAAGWQPAWKGSKQGAGKQILLPKRWWRISERGENNGSDSLLAPETLGLPHPCFPNAGGDFWMMFWAFKAWDVCYSITVSGLWLEPCTAPITGALHWASEIYPNINTHQIFMKGKNIPQYSQKRWRMEKTPSQQLVRQTWPLGPEIPLSDMGDSCCHGWPALLTWTSSLS